MNTNMQSLIHKLENEHSLSVLEYKYLIEHRCHDSATLLTDKAVRIRKEVYGNEVYIRGLIEFSNICKNDCLYCGIRRSNKNCERYRLSEDEILKCCREGYALGFRTFVLQSGEDVFFNDNIICHIIDKIHTTYPDCAITLSLGERSKKSYQEMFDAGADRYLLRHETADISHYKKLHPREMSFDNRMKCLRDLKDIGYQVGCGFMVGSPFQTSETLAKDLKFIEKFRPQMCGIGPFIPHAATTFANLPGGSLELTCYLLSIIRLIKPNILLPATTALGTIAADGREQGILAGANVVMPNLSPVNTRKKYELYDNKICTGEESAQCIRCLSLRMESIGYNIVFHRGDMKPLKKEGISNGNL